MRLDAFVARRLPDRSRARVQKAIGAGAIRLNARNATKKTAVSGGDVVTIDPDAFPPSTPGRVEAQNIPLDILYEDEYLLAVNKPAGLVVHPGSGNPEGTLVNALVYHVRSLSGGYLPDRPGIVHRLDKNTSGVLLVAKTDRVHAALGDLFARRRVDKEYVGVCMGRRPPDEGMIDAPIGRSRREPLTRTVRADGKKALTEYHLLCYRSGVSLLGFKIHTGRTHQIRVHCRHEGFPVLADREYGGGREAVKRLEPLERPFAYAVFNCFDRQALHARRLSCTHPVTGAGLTVEAPLPEDFRGAVAVFGYEGTI
jgi:23S rRNA pseudouridine1911/1915/1917 synthase